MPPPLTDAEYDARWTAKVAAGEQRGYSPNKVYGMKRRFSLATIIAMIVAASLLLALLKALDVSPLISGLLLGQISFAALCQMALFGGRRPRLASMIAGVVFSWVTIIVTLCAERHARGPSPDEFLVGLFFWTVFGIALGYAAGGAVAGVLLLMDLVESWLPTKGPARSIGDEP
jgi:hypothetical protein